jgi:hypothetical protein
VSARFLVGVGAWLLGAGAATGGSLLAVSLLGRGIIAPAVGQQLTVAAVNRALASEAAKRARPSPPATPSATPSPTPSPRHLKARRAAPTTPASAAPAPQPTSAVLTSVGGTVVARCGATGAYLVSWSPQQGYGAAGVSRGPAAVAQAKFGNGQRVVVMKVSCSGGVPTATISSHWSSDDGSGHDN